MCLISLSFLALKSDNLSFLLSIIITFNILCH
jgi:hypothetical protein